MNRKKVVIKKYENRRLYDTTNSRYVNLDEVARAVQDGCEVEVVDAATGEDITRLVLTQIIVEDAKEPNSPFPLDILRQMVIASGRASQEGALNYMKAMFDVYQNAYRAMPQPITPFDLMQSVMMGQGIRPPVPAPTPSPTQATGAHSGGANAHEKETPEVSELRRRLEELESQIASHGAKRTKRTSPKKASRRKKS